MSTITTSMSTDELDQLLSQAIGLVGECRLMADVLDPDRSTVDHDRAHMVQAGLISLQNSLGDGRPAPKLAEVHAFRVQAAMLAGEVL